MNTRSSNSKSGRSGGMGVVSWRGHVMPMAMSGLMLMLAYPPVGWGWVAHFALVPWAAVALKSAKPKRLIVSSYIVAVLWWLCMLNWLTQVTLSGYITLCAAMAVYMPLTWIVYRLLTAGWRWPSVVTLPMAWVCFEFIRAHLIAGGFPWFELGHTQAGYLPGDGGGRLIQVADLFGEHAVSFVVAATSGLIVDLLTRPLTAAGKGGRRTKRPLHLMLGIWFLIFGGALGYGQYRIKTTPAAQKSITVVVVQTNMPQDNKNAPTRESTERYWRQMIGLVREAAAASPTPDLVVCPETMVPAALNRDAVTYYTTAKTGERGMQIYYHELRALASELKVPLLMGASARYDWVKIPSGEPDVYLVLPKKRFNSAFLIDHDADKPVAQYDKIHRVPFGEYLPWVGSWPTIKRVFIKYLTPYDFDYSLTQGKEYSVFEVGEITLATPICFEDAVSRVTRPMVYDGQGVKRCDVLVNLTNDGWYPGSVQGYQHVQIATLRCVELRTPMVRSVNTGVSGFIDSIGRVTQQVQVDGQSQEVAGFATAQMLVDNRSTLFGRVGDWPMGLLCAVTLLFAVGAVTKVKMKRR